MICVISVLQKGTVLSFRFLNAQVLVSLTGGGLMSDKYERTNPFMDVYVEITFCCLRLSASVV